MRAAGTRTVVAVRHLCFEDLDLPVLHWHNDTFAMPAGAKHLAATARCQNQAFAVGAHLLGLPFHLETPARDIERWPIGHAEALAQAGIDPHIIRRDAEFARVAGEAAAVRVMDDWLTNLEASLDH